MDEPSGAPAPVHALVRRVLRPSDVPSLQHLGQFPLHIHPPPIPRPPSTNSAIRRNNARKIAAGTQAITPTHTHITTTNRSRCRPASQPTRLALSTVAAAKISPDPNRTPNGWELAWFACPLGRVPIDPRGKNQGRAAAGQAQQHDRPKANVAGSEPDHHGPPDDGQTEDADCC